MRYDLPARRLWPHDEPTHVIIVGGGASGVLLAVHLLRQAVVPFKVTLIEKRADVGRGLAYCTSNPEHLLNVRVSNMSAFPEDPDHFWGWLHARHGGVDIGGGFPLSKPSNYFAPRQLYGEYIAGLVEPLLSRSGQLSCLNVIRNECVSVSEEPHGAIVRLNDGSSLQGDFVVLATGHERPTISGEFCADPWLNLRGQKSHQTIGY